MQTLTVQDPWFSFIVVHKKTVEGRLNVGKFKDWKIGDIVKLNDKIYLKILKKRVYKSFKSMLEAEKLENVLPTVLDIEDGVAVYRQFYSEQSELEHGVLAIHIEVVHL